MGREEDFRKRKERFFEVPKTGISIARIQREFEIAKDRFPVVYGDEQFAKPGTLPDLTALTYAFDMVRTRNPNLVEPTMFLGAWEIEREAISMLSKMFNHPNYLNQDYSPEKDPVLGWFTDGGTSSILQASWTLRNKYCRDLEASVNPDFNRKIMPGIIKEEGWLGMISSRLIDPMKGPVILAPMDLHFAGDKVVDIIGRGANGIVRYELNEDFTTNYTHLDQVIKNILKQGRKIMFAFATAGAVDTGRVEDVQEFYNVLKKNNCQIPIIVDAAQQYMMLACLEEKFPAWDFRVEGVEAIVADPHKTDAAPYPASVIIFKDKNLAVETQNVHGYLHSDDYLDFDMKSTWQLMPSFNTSRSPIGAIATWVYLLTKGTEELIQKYNQLLTFTEEISNYVKNSDYYSLLAEPQTAIVSLHSKDMDDNKAKRVYERFEQNREDPRFYISFADCIRVKTTEEYHKYTSLKLNSPGKKINGYGGLYIQIMQHTTPELLDQLIKRLDCVGKEVMGK